jgi:hypothetical protein
MFGDMFVPVAAALGYQVLFIRWHALLAKKIFYSFNKN